MSDEPKHVRDLNPAAYRDAKTKILKDGARAAQLAAEARELAAVKAKWPDLTKEK